MSFFAELKRRNVIKVAAAYIIVGWLIMQAGEVMAPALRLPDWINSALAFFLILGFPVAMILAWAFEMTPEGLKREKDVDRTQSITGHTGRKIDFLIIALLAAALVYFAVDKFVLDPDRDEAEIAAALESAVPAEETVESAVNDRSIAVLPFVNMSSDAEQEYFSDGLSEELLNLLAKIPELQVAARTSSFSFKGQNIEIPEIAERLKVAHVLEGSVRKSGNQVRITAQLIQADNGFHLWSETYDRELDNVFQIQDEIAAHVVEALRVTLMGEAPHVQQTDAEAYRLFLEGRYFRRKSATEALETAIELLQQAVAIDPDYAPAWAELAYTFQWYTASGHFPIKEGNERTNVYLANALTSDPELGMAHFVNGVRAGYYLFDIEAAQEAWNRAAELEPGNAMYLAATGTGERLAGHFDKAIEIYQAGIDLDPVYAENRALQGMAYWIAGRLDEAEAAFMKALELSPDYISMRAKIGRVYLDREQPDTAIRWIEQERSEPYRLSALAMVHSDLDNPAASDDALDRLIAEYADVAAIQIAEANAYRGDIDEAFEWLDQSLAIRDSGINGLLGNPAFRNLLKDPRWAELLEGLGWLEAWQDMPPEWGGPQP